MLGELEKAADLEPNKETFQLLHKAYMDKGMQLEADEVEQKLKKLIVPSGRPKKVIRPRRVVI
jgi:hypothetical protein